MIFRWESKAIITLTLVSLLSALSTSFPNRGFAKSDEDDPVKATIKEKEDEIKRIGKEITRLQNPGYANQWGNICGDNTVVNSCEEKCKRSQCPNEYGDITDDIMPNACVSIYTAHQSVSGQLTGVKESCSFQIRNCGEVNLLKCIARKKVELKDLKDDLKEYRDGNKESLTAKKKNYSNCPLCELYGREPTTGETIVMGINAVTPALLGGLGAYMYGKGMNGYYGGYNNYLQSCTTFGIPCQPPLPYGGMGGGGFGMGGG
ncbi:MAG: hypothetical protein AABZ55_01895 [Bdellovibrionota bacterium]